MATIIAIESTSSVCGVCLINNKSITDEITIDGGNIHDQMLADSVRNILERNGITDFSSIDAVAVSAGPGSFTGIRIGASVAKGLCFGNEPKFIAVPTMKAVTNAFIQSNTSIECDKIITLLSSVNNTAFMGKFNRDLTQLQEIELIDINNFNFPADSGTVFCGNVNNSENIINKFHKIDLSPKHIASLSYEMYEKGLFTNPENFKPIYAQEFVPKIKLKNIQVS